MWRSYLAQTALLALWFTACATGAGDVSFDEDDGDGGTVQGAGGTGDGGSAGDGQVECTHDAYCTDLSDDCNRGTCIDGTCVAVAANEQLDCEDEDSCTTTGICAAGVCEPGPQIDCTALDEDCLVGVCDSEQGCVQQPGNVGVACDDGVFCTAGDVCDDSGNCGGPDVYDCGPPSGACVQVACESVEDACVESPLTMCVPGDGCCPSGCSLPQDTDCNCSTNHGATAVGSSSGGGQPSCCGVERMNDGVTEPVCEFHWINNDTTPSGAFIEYQWSSPVTVGSIYIATPQSTSTTCSSSGRNVFSGDVQHWDGSMWVTATSFTGELDDVAVDLPSPVTTTGLRVSNMTTSAGNGNSMIYEWFVFPAAGCSPP